MPSLILFLFLFSASVSFSGEREIYRIYIYICMRVYRYMRERVYTSSTDQGSQGSVFISIRAGLGGQHALSASELEIGYLQIESIQTIMNRFITVGSG